MEIVDHGDTNENIRIENIPWAMDMRQRLNKIFDSNFTAWVKIVVDLSDNLDDIKEWIDEFEEHYEGICTEIVSDIERLQSKFHAKIEESLETIKGLCMTLQIQMPQFGREKKALYREHIDLLKHIEKYEQQIKLRRDEVDALKKKARILCDSLGKEPKTLSDNPLPSSEEIDEFQMYLDKLEEERFCRVESYCSARQAIINLIEKLEYKPQNSFEIAVLESQNFEVTDENMKSLNNFHQHLEKMFADLNEDIPQMWSKIENLWNILDIPLLDREHFKQANSGINLITQKKLEEELRRCEQLKKDNIQTFIEKLRNQLEKLWAKSHVCVEDAKNKFQYFDYNCYTEDLLSLFEIEVDKWSVYYEKNRELINLLEKHKQLWNKLMELEAKSEDPLRFNNRGGQLLREEKERNLLCKQVPVSEKKLLDLADQFFKRNGEQFQSYGQTVEDFIQNLHEDRENIKKQKSSARKLRLQSTITPSKSVTSLYTTGSALKLVTPKRKLLATPHDQEKRAKFTPKTPLTEPQQNVNKRLAVPKITVTAATTKRRSADWKKRVDKMRKKSAQLKLSQEKLSSKDNSITEYADFQDVLKERTDSHSTIYVG